MVEKKTWLISFITKTLGGSAGALAVFAFVGGFALIPFLASIGLFVATGILVFFQKDIEEKFAKEIAVVEAIGGVAIEKITPELVARFEEAVKKADADKILKLHRGE